MTDKTALLVIDLQNDFTQPWGKAYYETTGEMMPRVCEVIDKMREQGVWIVYVTSENELAARPNQAELTRRKQPVLVKGTPGAALDERLPYRPGADLRMQKYAPSAFFKTDLVETLQQKGIRNVLVCGVKTNLCVRATAVDAMSYGFYAYIVSDMTATNTKELAEYHLEELTKYTAKAVDSEQVLGRINNGQL